MRRDSPARGIVRPAAAGCLAVPIGLTLAALVLIPLWLYWLPSDSADVLLPTMATGAFVIAYALAVGAVTLMGLPASWWIALSVAVLGGLGGSALGSLVRQAVLDSCLHGTGPQPEWCFQPDAPYVAWVLPAYVMAGAFLGVGLFVAGAVGLKLQRARDDL